MIRNINSLLLPNGQIPSKNPICPPLTVTKIAKFSILSALSSGKSKHKSKLS